MQLQANAAVYKTVATASQATGCPLSVFRQTANRADEAHDFGRRTGGFRFTEHCTGPYTAASMIGGPRSERRPGRHGRPPNCRTFLRLFECHQERLSSGSVLVELGGYSLLSVSFPEPTRIMSPSPSDRGRSTRSSPTNVPFLLPRSSIVAHPAEILIRA